MKFSHLVNSLNPICYYTFEDLAGDESSIYDSSGNNYTLTNYSLTFENGPNNLNFSTKSASFTGYSISESLTILNDQIETLNVYCILNFRVSDGQTIVGNQPLVSKWGIEQQFWLGFESGILTLKIQNTNGLATYTFDKDFKDYIVYNTTHDVWNTVCFRITQTNVFLGINGYTVFDGSVISSILPSNIVPLTIGSDVVTNSNLLLSDIAFIDSTVDTVTLNRAIRLLTADRKDIIANFNPAYWFEIGEDFYKYRSTNIKNRGYKNTYNPFGSICNQTGVDLNTLSYASFFHKNEPYFRFGLGGTTFFTIQGEPLSLVFPNDVSFMARHRHVFTETNTTNWTTNFAPVLKMALAETSSNSNWKFLYQESTESTNQADAYDWRTPTYITNGSNAVILNYNSTPNDDNNANRWHNTDGVLMWRITNGATTFRHYIHETYSRTLKTNTDSYAPGAFTSYNPPSIGYNIFFRSTTDAYQDVSWFTIFEYNVPLEVMSILALDEHIIYDDLVSEIIRQPTQSFYFNDTGSVENAASTATYTGGSLLPLIDTNGEYPFNESISTRKLQLGDYITWSSNGPWGYIFTSHFFVYNTNDTERHVLYYVSNDTTLNLDEKFQLSLNSANGGQFLAGSVEFTANSFAESLGDTRYSFHVENAITTQGFHSITLVRRDAYEFELWIDGVLRKSHNMPNLIFAGSIITSSSPSWTFAGTSAGDIYIKNYKYFQKYACSPEEIYLLAGYHKNTITGVTQLNQVAVESKLALINHDTGDILLTAGTDVNGSFSVPLFKSAYRQDLIALPLDGTVTNHVVAHGPYSGYSDVVVSTVRTNTYDQTVYEAIEETAPWLYWDFLGPDDSTIPNMGSASGDASAYFTDGRQWIEANDITTIADCPRESSIGYYYLDGSLTNLSNNGTQAIRFNNSNILNTIHNETLSAGNDRFTISFLCWHHNQSGSLGVYLLTTSGDDDSARDYTYKWCLLWDATEVVSFSDLNNALNQGYLDAKTSARVKTIAKQTENGVDLSPAGSHYQNHWILHSFIVNTTSGEIQHFLNGRESSTTMNDYYSYTNWTNTHVAGMFNTRYQSFWGTQFKGGVGPVFWHNRGLSKDDMKKIYAIVTKRAEYPYVMEYLIKADSPFAYWRFDKTDGLNANIGDTAGTPWAFTTNQTPAVIEYGARVLSPGEYLTNSDFAFATSSSVSAEFIFKTTGTVQNGAILVGDWDQVTNSGQGVFKFVLTSGGQVQLYINNESTFVTTSIGGYNNFEWYHVAFTFDVAQALVSFYINGTLADTISTSMPMTNATGTITVGSDSLQTSSTLLTQQIHIDDLALYNSLLDATTIAARYAQMQEKKEYI